MTEIRTAEQYSSGTVDIFNCFKSSRDPRQTDCRVNFYIDFDTKGDKAHLGMLH